MSFYEEYARMQHIGHEDIAKEINKRLYCQECERELNDEEIDHCVDLCFKCFKAEAEDDYLTNLHPDKVF